MQLCGVLVLMGTLCAAYGLRCYTCVSSDPKACTQILTCPPGHDRCSSTEGNGGVIKGCLISNGCTGPTKCCEGDLCNGAMPTGSSVFLLLVSSAIITLFL